MASGHDSTREGSGAALTPAQDKAPRPRGGSPGPGGFPGRQGLSRPTRSCETRRARRSPSSISVCWRMWRLQSPWGARPRGTSGAAPGGGVSRGQAPAAAERGATVSARGCEPATTSPSQRGGTPTHPASGRRGSPRTGCPCPPPSWLGSRPRGAPAPPAAPGARGGSALPPARSTQVRRSPVPPTPGHPRPSLRAGMGSPGHVAPSHPRSQMCTSAPTSCLSRLATTAPLSSGWALGVERGCVRRGGDHSKAPHCEQSRAMPEGGLLARIDLGAEKEGSNWKRQPWHGGQGALGMEARDGASPVASLCCLASPPTPGIPVIPILPTSHTLRSSRNHPRRQRGTGGRRVLAPSRSAGSWCSSRAARG